MNVIVTQSTDSGNDTVDTPWASNTDGVGALLAVAQLLQHAKDDTLFAPSILSITIEL